MTPAEAADTGLLSRRRALGLLGGAGLVAGLAACNRSSGTAAAAGGDERSPATAPADDGNHRQTATTARPPTRRPSSTAASTTTVDGRRPHPHRDRRPATRPTAPTAPTPSPPTASSARTSAQPPGTGSATADGVALDIELTLADATTGAVLPGHAVYLWHCDRTGNYSLYGDVTGESYLRGVGVADADGVVRFTSVFPAAYDGRWPHIHFEVFDDAGAATTGRNAVRASQLALPEADLRRRSTPPPATSRACATSPRPPCNRDMVFSDGVDLQLATMSGRPPSGYLAQLVVGI